MSEQVYFSVQELREERSPKGSHHAVIDFDWVEVHCATTHAEACKEMRFLKENNIGTRYKIVPIKMEVK